MRKIGQEQEPAQCTRGAGSFAVFSLTVAVSRQDIPDRARSGRTARNHQGGYGRQTLRSAIERSLPPTRAPVIPFAREASVMSNMCSAAVFRRRGA